jgi:hypothetical protein
MITIVSILLGISVIIFFLYKWGLRKAGVPVLKAKVTTEDGYLYCVEFEKLHQETKDIEFVRMVINFTAKILYITEDKHENIRNEILNFIDLASKTDMKPEDIDRLMPLEVKIRKGEISGKTIEGTLCFVNTNNRNIITYLPISWFEHQLSHSVIVLTRATVEYLNDDFRQYLKRYLLYMSDSYKSGANPRNLNTMRTLPNEAFILG